MCLGRRKIQFFSKLQQLRWETPIGKWPWKCLKKSIIFTNNGPVYEKKRPNFTPVWFLIAHLTRWSSWKLGTNPNAFQYDASWNFLQRSYWKDPSLKTPNSSSLCDFCDWSSTFYLHFWEKNHACLGGGWCTTFLWWFRFRNERTFWRRYSWRYKGTNFWSFVGRQNVSWLGWLFRRRDNPKCLEWCHWNEIILSSFNGWADRWRRARCFRLDSHCKRFDPDRNVGRNGKKWCLMYRFEARISLGSKFGWACNGKW